MNKLYNVVLGNGNLEFRFTINSTSPNNAEDIAIEYLVDSEDFNNQVLGLKLIKIEELSNTGGVISFNVYNDENEYR